MPARRDAAATTESREEAASRPSRRSCVRRSRRRFAVVERAVDVPEAGGVTPSTFEFRDAGQEPRQRGPARPGVASRKKGYVCCGGLVRASLPTARCSISSTSGGRTSDKVQAVLGNEPTTIEATTAGVSSHTTSQQGLVGRGQPWTDACYRPADVAAPFADASPRRAAAVRQRGCRPRRCCGTPKAKGERLRAAIGAGSGWSGRRSRSRIDRHEGARPTNRRAWGWMRSACRCKASGASRAEHRMLYTALVYTPDKKHHRYLAPF